MLKWRYSSTVLDLDTRWRSVVQFKAQTLYLLDRKLSGPQPVWMLWRKKTFALAENQTAAIQPIASRCTAG
jgi:hypothetical protein